MYILSIYQEKAKTDSFPWSYSWNILVGPQAQIHTFFAFRLETDFTSMFESILMSS